MSEEFDRVYNELSTLTESVTMVDKGDYVDWIPSNNYNVNTTPITPRDVIIYNIETHYDKGSKEELLNKLKSGSNSFTEEEQEYLAKELTHLNEICHKISVKDIPVVVASEVDVVKGIIDFPDNHIRSLSPVAAKVNGEFIKYSTYATNIRLRKDNNIWEYTGKAIVYYTVITKPCATIDDTIYDTRLPVDFLGDCLFLYYINDSSRWHWPMSAGISKLKQKIREAGLSYSH